jgi:GNAT superfamily N-acetyltransferase
MTSFPAVRRAKTTDQERLGTLWMAFMDEQAGFDERLVVADDARERWDNDFPIWLTDETQATFVAESDGVIQGFATAHRWGPPPIYAATSEVYLDELYVASEARRQGLGTQLVHAVHHWAESVSAERIRLQALTANPNGEAFWASFEARPFATTRTIELNRPESPNADSSSRTIGFT